MNWDDILKAGLVLFAVIDIIGAIPVILELKAKSGKVNAEKASIVSLVLMLAFLVLGEKIIGVFGIDVESFAVAGSFILFFLALEMILGVQIFKDDPEISPDVASIVPLAFPIIAGAGTMTSILSLRAEYSQLDIGMAILINMILVYAVLKSTRPIERVLGKGGIAILKRAFGIILLAIAVRLFTANLSALF